MTDSQFNLLYDEIKGVKVILTGNGDPKKGMIVRLDRAEVKLRHYDWAIKTALFIAFTGVCGLLADLAVKSF